MHPLVERLLDPDILGVFIPIIAIVGGIAAGITKMIIDHRERIARIENGLPPDGPFQPNAQRPPHPAC